MFPLYQQSFMGISKETKPSQGPLQLYLYDSKSQDPIVILKAPILLNVAQVPLFSFTKHSTE